MHVISRILAHQLSIFQRHKREAAKKFPPLVARPSSFKLSFMGFFLERQKSSFSLMARPLLSPPPSLSLSLSGQPTIGGTLNSERWGLKIVFLRVNSGIF